MMYKKLLNSKPMPKTKSELVKDINKRNSLINSTSIITGAVITHQWTTPIVKAVIIPAHAQTSPSTLPCADLGIGIEPYIHIYREGGGQSGVIWHSSTPDVPAGYVAINVGANVTNTQAGDTIF